MSLIINPNGQLVGRATVDWAPGAPTLAQAGTPAYPYISLGNIETLEIKADKKLLEYWINDVTSRRLGDTFYTDGKLTYMIDLGEIDLLTLQVAGMASALPDFTQSVQAAVAGDALAFSAPNPSRYDGFYDLRIGGVRIRNITTVTIAGKVEGTDFIVDKVNGKVNFLTTQTTSLTPTITAPAITAGRKQNTPLANPVQRGWARVIVYDQTGRPRYEHVDFSGNLGIEKLEKIDGQKYVSASLSLFVTTTVGKLLVDELAL